MSRRVFFIGVATVVVSLAFLLTDRLLYPTRMTDPNVRRISRALEEWRRSHPAAKKQPGMLDRLRAWLGW